MAVAEALESVRQDEFFFMSNLSPKRTGLPFIVWVSTGTGAKHDVRVKVSRGRKVDPSKFIVVGIHPEVHIIHGELTNLEFVQLKQWIQLNYDAILQYWQEDIDTAELIEKLSHI